MERPEANISVGGENFTASAEHPFVFGRARDEGIVGLDPGDMGISAEAGSIQFELGLWWVLNRSQKRPLFLEPEPGSQPLRVRAGDRNAITKSQTVVLVPGAIYTHRIDVRIADSYASALQVPPSSASGTITFGDIEFSERDRDALSALFSGYLRPFPHWNPRPLSYEEAAALLGEPWTKVAVRKQIERLKERFARAGFYVQGPRANDDLAEHLTASGLISQLSLSRLTEAS
jgi:AcrR family transcriptional regulator